MDLLSLQMLLTPLGQQVLAAAQSLEPREANFLRNFTILRRSYPDDLARSALEIAILRREAASKFPQAGAMYFTRPALEQASSHAISTYRAGRYTSFERILDLGCSVGGDTLALADVAQTIGVDLDPLRLRMAHLNLQAALPSPGFERDSAPSESDVHFIQADLRQTLPVHLSAPQAIFFDPARREAGRRIRSVERYQPPLGIIQSWVEHTPAIGVKISPGVDLAEIQNFDAELEFISSKGELKEAVLWLGPLMTARRRATLLPGPFTLASEAQDVDPQNPLADNAPPLPLSDPLGYLYEPDPAVLRAGLVRSLGAKLDSAQLDPDIAYLTCMRPVETPFARGFLVEDWLPFNLKRLRATLRERGIQQVTVKKRGSPISPEALIHDLHLQPGSGSSPGSASSPDERVIVLTHLRGKPIALICVPII
jgi:SAM-dependent methyltransferase